MYVQALFGDPSDSSSTKEVKSSVEFVDDPALKAHQAPKRDSSGTASKISDGYPLMQSLRLSSPGIPEGYKTVNNLGKRSASHELLPAHVQKQIRIGSTRSPALVIGAPSSSSNERHGTEKANEQEAKIQRLEARISHLTTLVKSLKGNCITSQQQALGAQEKIVDIFRHQSTVLEEPMKEIKLLQTRAGLLETTTASLQQELNIAYIKIQAQEQVIKRISGQGNDTLEEESGHDDCRNGEDENRM